MLRIFERFFLLSAGWRALLAFGVVLLSRGIDMASTIWWVDPRTEANPLWQSGLVNWDTFLWLMGVEALGWGVLAALFLHKVMAVSLPGQASYTYYLRTLYGVDKDWKMLLRLRGSFTRQGLRLLGYTLVVTLWMGGPCFALNNAVQFYLPVDGRIVYAACLLVTGWGGFLLAFRLEFAKARILGCQSVQADSKL